MAEFKTPLGAGAEVSAKEVVIVIGAGAACIVLLYWLGKREVEKAVETVADATTKTAKAAGDAIVNTSQGLNNAGNGIVKNVIAATVPKEQVKAATSWWDSWSIGTKVYDLTHYEEAF
jgi:hypothetical protein